MAKRILSTLLCVVLLATSLVAVNAATIGESSTSVAGDTKYSIASQELDDKYGYDGNDLGATYTPEATTFKVWAPTATEVTLNLFATGSDNEEGAADLGNYALEKVLATEGDEESFTGVWSVVVEGDLKNVYYTYSITAANVTGTKTTKKETQDIYSVATGVNSKRSMVCDLDSTDPEGWENDKHVLLDKNTDSSVWEIHVKDFTYAESSGVSKANRGKYLGFTETGTTLNGEGNLSTCIDYLKELGVTTVQILPFYDYGSVNEAGSDDQFNWGYDPVNYNVPEGSYSSNPYDGNVRIKECKQMIQALHEAGFSVVMDVVYNHTYSYDSCFEATVPNYYYRMTAAGGYSNGSGCGNETASERRMYRNYVIQSCLYWVNEFHVDGFRFDLMGIMDAETMNMIRAELDKVDPRITMWGEGWTGGDCAYPNTTCSGTTLVAANQAGAPSLHENIALFNDGIRDGLKGGVFNADEAGWVQGAKGSYNAVFFGLNANTRGGNWTAKAPSQCVTYASCHDNTTLWDKLCDSNMMTEYYDKRNEKILLENKLTAALLNMSQGILFYNAGEEMGRTKLGDHNSYSSSAEVNMIDWTLVQSNADLVSYYKGLLDIRNNFAPITDNTTGSLSNYLVYTGRAVSDKLAFVVSNDTEGQWNKLAVLANSTGEALEYELLDNNKEWVIIANDKTAGVKSLGEVTNGKFTIPARSAIIAVDKASFQSVALASDKGTVTVKYVDKATGKVLDESVITGTIGTTYETAAATSLSQEYELAEVKGNEVGTFTAEDQDVTYYYGYYVPESANADVNGDGKVNINDATLIQKSVAKMVELSAEQATVADCNLDGTVDINDVTMLQRHLAGMSVGLGSVVVNYYKTGTTETIAESVVYTGRVGETYTATLQSALGYAVNKESLPESETVTIANGTVKEINYYYDYVGANVNLHVKHNGTLTWAPTLWIWGQKNGVDSANNYCQNKTWPGDTLTAGEDGWYTTSFECDSSDNAYNVIVSKKGSPQSADCKGFTQLELWIYIDDQASQDGVSLLFYDENPELNEYATPIYQA